MNISLVVSFTVVVEYNGNWDDAIRVRCLTRYNEYARRIISGN